MPATKPAPNTQDESRKLWEAWSRELAELRTECSQLNDIFVRLWDEMEQLRSELAVRTEQHEQLRQLAEQQQQQLADRSDNLQQAMSRMEERQQQFAEIFSELLSLREGRRRPS